MNGPEIHQHHSKFIIRLYGKFARYAPADKVGKEHSADHKGDENGRRGEA